MPKFPHSYARAQKASDHSTPLEKDLGVEGTQKDSTSIPTNMGIAMVDKCFTSCIESTGRARVDHTEGEEKIIHSHVIGKIERAIAVGKAWQAQQFGDEGANFSPAFR